MLTVLEADSIVRTFVDRLMGDEERNLAQAGLLRTTGLRGRAGELAILSSALDGALDRYANSDSAPAPYKGRTARDVTAALRKRWGIGAYPTRSALQDRVGQIVHRTLANWEQRAYASEDFRRELEKQILELAAHGSRVDDGWLTTLPTALPPASAARTALLALARHSGVEGDDRELVQTIRQVVTHKVRAYLKAEPVHLIHHREIVEGAWFRDDVRFVEPVRGMLTSPKREAVDGEHGEFLRTSRAVVTLQFYLCLIDARHFTAELQAEARSRAAYKVFLTPARTKINRGCHCPPSRPDSVDGRGCPGRPVQPCRGSYFPSLRNSSSPSKRAIWSPTDVRSRTTGNSTSPYFLLRRTCSYRASGRPVGEPRCDGRIRRDRV